MGSPINGITSIDYDSSWMTMIRIPFLANGIDGLDNTTQYNFPKTAGGGPGNRLAFSYGSIGSTPEGLLINNWDTGAPTSLYESWATESPAGTITLSNNWSLSNITVVGTDIKAFTLSYTDPTTTTSTTTSTTSTTTQNLPLVSLEMTLSQIHSTKTAQELSDNLSVYKSQIKGILDLNIESQSTYYKNHTGRELFRKLYNFDLSHLIPTTYDAGFRPDDNSLGS